LIIFSYSLSDPYSVLPLEPQIFTGLRCVCGLKGRNRRLEKLCNEEQNNLYSSPGIFRTVSSWRIGFVRFVPRMGYKINANKILVRRPEKEATCKIYMWMR
jgi:hypothetical protein